MIYKTNDSIEKLKLDKDFEAFLVTKNIKAIKDLFEYDYQNLREVYKTEKKIKELSDSEINIFIDSKEIPDLKGKNAEAFFIASDGYCYLNKMIIEVDFSNTLKKNIVKFGYDYMVDIFELSKQEINDIFTEKQADSFEKIIALYKKDNLVFRYRISGINIPYTKLAFVKYLDAELERLMFDGFKSDQCYSEIMDNYDELSKLDLSNPLEMSMLDVDDKVAILNLPSIRAQIITSIEDIYLLDMFSGVNYQTIASVIPEFLRYDKSIVGILEEMVDKDYLYYDEGLYFLELPNLPYVVNNMPPDVNMAIVQSVLTGMPIADIAFDYEMDKITVESIVIDFLNTTEVMYEDRYARLFQEYYILQSDFSYGFDDNEYVYKYLSIKYKRGKKFISNLVSDYRFSEEFRDAANTIINRENSRNLKS